jgi:hypothetical protein
MIAFAIVTLALSSLSFANGIQSPNYGGEVASRRAMTGTGSLLLMGLITYATVAFFLTRPKPGKQRSGRYLRTRPTDHDRKKGLYLFVLLTVAFTLGQAAEYLAGARWVEIGAIGSTQHAQPQVEFLGLTYNVLFEGAIFYMPYYTIPLGLGLIASITKGSPK